MLHSCVGGVERKKTFSGFFYRDSAPQIEIVKVNRRLAQRERELYRVVYASSNASSKNFAGRLNARLTRLVVAFSPIESKRCRLTSGIARNTTLYASVQTVPFRQIQPIGKKERIFFFFLFLQRSHCGASPLFETTPFVALRFR